MAYRMSAWSLPRNTEYPFMIFWNKEQDGLKPVLTRISNGGGIKRMHLKNVVSFFREHGADENTIRMVEAQCSRIETENFSKYSTIILSNHFLSNRQPVFS